MASKATWATDSNVASRGSKDNRGLLRRSKPQNEPLFTVDILWLLRAGTVTWLGSVFRVCTKSRLLPYPVGPTQPGRGLLPTTAFCLSPVPSPLHLQLHLSPPHTNCWVPPSLPPLHHMFLCHSGIGNRSGSHSMYLLKQLYIQMFIVAGQWSGSRLLVSEAPSTLDHRCDLCQIACCHPESG